MSFIKQTKQRIINEICRSYSHIKISSNIIKSSSLKSIYKIIQCRTLSTKQIKNVIDIMTSQSISREKKIESAQQICRKLQQYLNQTINILQANQKVRQKYNSLSQILQQTKSSQQKQLSHLYRSCNLIKQKSSFLTFLSQSGVSLFNESTQKSLLFDIKQVLTPINPDLYDNIKQINQDYYFQHLESIMQDFMIWSKRTQQINHNKYYQHPNLIYLLKQIFNHQIFMKQDNILNRLYGYVLRYANDNSQMVAKYQHQCTYYRKNIAHATLRQYYLLFLAKNQIQIILSHVQTDIKINSKGHLISIDQIHTKIQLLNQTEVKVNQICEFLVDKEEKYFKQIYNRKIKKIMIIIDNVQNVLISCKKQLKMQQKQVKNKNISNSTQGKNKISQQQMLKSSQQQVLKISKQVQLKQKQLKQKQSSLFLQIKNYISQLQKKTKVDQHTIMQKFNYFIGTVQYMQIQYTNVKQQQDILSKLNIHKNYRLDHNIKKNIIQMEMNLINGIKQYKDRINSDQNKYSQVHFQDDKASVYSAYSSKVSVFQHYQLDDRQVILQKQRVNQNYLPLLKYQQFIKITNQFVTKQFIQNKQLAYCLQDKHQINVCKLQNLIYQLQHNPSLTDINIQSLQQEISPVQLLKKSPQKSKKTVSKKQKQKQKTLIDKKNKQSQTKLLKQVSIRKQQLINIKFKLQLIRELILQQISQNHLEKIFQKHVHTDLLIRFCSIIINYKHKIQSQNLLNQCKKHGFQPFLQQRLNYVNTIAKNLPQLIQILQIIRILSQQSLKLDPFNQNTFSLILKCLLAEKQIQAYRQQNQDLVKNGKLSEKGVRFLQQKIYQPFLHIFKILLKINSSQSSIKIQLNEMLDNVKKCIDTNQGIKQLIQDLYKKKVTIQQAHQKIKKFIQQLSFKKYNIFKNKNLDNMVKVLKNSLKIQLVENDLDKLSEYLQKQLI